MSNPVVTKQNIAIGFSVDTSVVDVRVTSINLQVLASVAAGLDNLVRVTQVPVEVLLSASPAKAPSVSIIQHGWNPDLDVPPELETDLEP
jgi:hypothetical protein